MMIIVLLTTVLLLVAVVIIVFTTYVKYVYTYLHKLPVLILANISLKNKKLH